MFNEHDQFMRKLIDDLYKQQEELLLTSIKDLVTSGLLIIEKTPLQIFQSPDSDGYKLEFKEGIRLVVKDKDYIKKLETENKELKEKLDKIKGIV